MDGEQCDTCRKQVNNNESAIECENCERWQHFECSGLTKGEFDVVKRKNCKLTWLCAECKPKILKTMDIEEKLTEKMKVQMETLMTEMRTSMGNILKAEIKSTLRQELREQLQVQMSTKTKAPPPPS